MDSEAKPASLRQLQQDAAAWYAGVDSYIVRMTRREVVGGEAKLPKVRSGRSGMVVSPPGTGATVDRGPFGPVHPPRTGDTCADRMG